MLQLRKYVVPFIAMSSQTSRSKRRGQRIDPLPFRILFIAVLCLLVSKAWQRGATTLGVSRWALCINSHYSVLDRAERFRSRRIGGDWPSRCFVRSGKTGCRIEIAALA